MIMGRLVRVVLAVVMVTQLVSCGRSPTESPDDSTRWPDVRLDDDRVLSEVSLDEDGGYLFVDYRTSVSLADCAEMQAEVRAVWSEVLRDEAAKRNVDHVVVWPTDPSGRAQSFTYELDQSRQWREANFVMCRD